MPYPIDSDAVGGEFDMCGDVKAGFPSPADDMREKLDLVRLLVRHPASTFFFRVSGTSMVDASLDEGDIIIVDKSLEPHDGCIAVCHIDGEFTVKRVAIDAHGVKLMVTCQYLGALFLIFGETDKVANNLNQSLLLKHTAE